MRVVLFLRPGEVRFWRHLIRGASSLLSDCLSCLVSAWRTLCGPLLHMTEEDWVLLPEVSLFLTAGSLKQRSPRRKEDEN